MKYIPILYSTLMVKALLQGNKSKTRRTKGLEFINNSFSDWEYLGINGIRHLMQNEYGAINAIQCPYGQPGDIHWVRETFSECGFKGNYVYKADDETLLTDYDKWKPNIYMPKSACRIFLEITVVKIERLQDITEEDAVHEGVHQYDDGTFKNYFKSKGLRERDGVECLLAVGSFQSLWCSINGLDSWKSNPWVWVIEFKKVEVPQNGHSNKFI
jgi:hypothetical protein